MRSVKKHLWSGLRSDCVYKSNRITGALRVVPFVSLGGWWLLESNKHTYISTRMTDDSFVVMMIACCSELRAHTDTL